MVREDPEALADAWERLLCNPATRDAMGAAARRRAESAFAPDDHARDVLAFYEEVCAASL